MIQIQESFYSGLKQCFFLGWGQIFTPQQQKKIQCKVLVVGFRKKCAKVAIFKKCVLGGCQNKASSLIKCLFCWLTFSQIWLIPLVHDCQSTYLTKVKRKSMVRTINFLPFFFFSFFFSNFVLLLKWQ
jgi:hypothetical protein